MEKGGKAHSLGPQSPLCSILSNPCQDVHPWREPAWHPGVPAGVKTAFLRAFLLCSLTLGRSPPLGCFLVAKLINSPDALALVAH